MTKFIDFSKKNIELTIELRKNENIIQEKESLLKKKQELLESVSPLNEKNDSLQTKINAIILQQEETK
jgi:hypothetical protein